ncbi:hypothetical protein U9M48_005364 [Paspalum notatum var. saurae]|uniref:Uncharacterized protein n=1 Tax=Paspalum notatum var. saurae TaxID=547442 RepID=A0AAQ3PQ07_PASNO
MGLEEADAKMVVATSHGDCQKLKNLVQQQDPTTILVVMASTKHASAEKKPPRASMHPLLAAAACRGNLQELKFLLLKREQTNDGLKPEFLKQAEAYNFTSDNTTSAIGAGSDVEQGGGIDDDAVPLVNGVTMEGDTVLHLVVTNGDAQNFLDYVDFIHGLEGGLLLLSKENHNGDTPLHCAARAARTKMVSRLIALAKYQGKVEQLLRKENKRKETALHEVVRIGDNHMVAELLRADGRLASFPEGNKHTSPLYLAINLGRAETAETLHDQSEKRFLSYSGPDGQNALHAAVLRGIKLHGRRIHE